LPISPVVQSSLRNCCKPNALTCATPAAPGGEIEHVARALAPFLCPNRAASEDQLKRAITKSSFEELRRQEQERGFNERPEVAEKLLREGRAGQWPRALTKQSIQGALQ
jgi:hypothetical protein